MVCVLNILVEEVSVEDIGVDGGIGLTHIIEGCGVILVDKVKGRKWAFLKTTIS
jgi:hypothetical protein